jgi:pyridoxine 4-dehydrogenase
MAKGTVPIPGARSRQQCLQNLGALELQLTTDEVDALDRAALAVKRSTVQNSMASA